MSQHTISDEYLNAFIDNQLDSTERMQAYNAIRNSNTLKDRVCELSGLKEMMQHAYANPPFYARPTLSQRATWRKQAQAVAACLLLLLGGVSGWFTHAWTNSKGTLNIGNIIQATTPVDAGANVRKVIVQVNNANPAKLKAALDETEGLLETYRKTKQQLEIEVITNTHGVNLLRSNFTTHEKRIAKLQEKYPNLKFLVCGQTINKLRNKGESVKLLPHVDVVSSAADQINKRLEQGWGYVRI